MQKLSIEFFTLIPQCHEFMCSSLMEFRATFPQVISFCSGRIWGIGVEDEVAGDGGVDVL